MKSEEPDGKDQKTKKSANWAEFNRSFGMVFNIGYYISASILIGLFAGYQADKYFGTAPLFTLALTFLGMAAGMLELFKVTKIK
ncbi:MAG TPA: AtpZ/AtpI family protein [Candidatus Wallbacteria bacterium]|nr:AtpZ/AtpI family protein [Candidatus Wallbacteria bacterium]HPG57231.1 AtpZ/AtpI family protein [Candidatus Wallbacteria bacterium]